MSENTPNPLYIGVKLVHAYPAPAPKEVRGENKPGDQGYTIIYEDGYTSWSPKDVFEKAYRFTSGMNFGLAIEAMKKGLKVARKGWNGKNMFCFLVDGSTFVVNRAPLNKFYPEGTEVKYHSHIDMKTADGTIVPWLASQSDMLGDDWFIVND